MSIDGEEKKNIFKKIFNNEVSLNKSHILNNQEKITIKFSDLFSTTSKHDKNDRQSDIFENTHINNKQQSVDIAKSYNQDELEIIDAFFNENYKLNDDDIRVWNLLFFEKNNQSLDFSSPRPSIGKYFFIMVIFFLFSISISIWLNAIFIPFMIYLFIKGRRIIYSSEYIVEKFISRKHLKIQYNKTTLLNFIYNYITIGDAPKTLFEKNKLKQILYEAHINAEEKKIIPTYYSTYQLLIDYVSFLLNKKSGTNYQFLVIEEYVTFIFRYLNDFKTSKK